MAKKRLSARQLAVLAFIWGYIGERGFPPTVFEVQQACGDGAPRGAVGHLEALERLGYLRRRPGLACGLEVVKVPIGVLRLLRTAPSGRKE